MTGSENERLARVEIEVKHMRETQEEMKRQVSEMHAAFLAAKGARYVIIVMWMGFGAFIVNIKWLLGALGVKFN